jgi:nucleotide-binding universal stress UspA family protein
MTETSEQPKIIVGVDGSPSSVGALQRSLRIGPALGARIVAVAAWSYPAMFGGGVALNWSPEDDAKQILAHAAHEVFGDEIPEWFSSEVHQGPPAQVLLEASKGAEMLVVGSRGRGGFLGLLLGSVSSNVAEYADCPVLIYHHEAKEVVHREPANADL